ncbi:MAG: 23S rRNA (adenine(2503)-C(2))-methyltransferase RlmN, partial [Candidatus Izemoplasmatales bacterium]
QIAKEQASADGTHKYLLRLEDNSLIETVLMQHDYGMSLCVTSQIGCSMGCAFCASGLKKRQRNLEVFELVGQILAVAKHMKLRISHVVVMGTGEPFDNYDQVIRFIKTINDDKGLAIGQRHITVSTCGIVPKILAYADEPIRSNLAISLHAPNDRLRSKLMPINKRYPIQDVIAACEVYFKKTSRRVTYEYILLSGVNDSLDMADELAQLLRGQNAYVNLIPYNPVGEFAFKQTDLTRASAFMDHLAKKGINTILRKEQGADIQAACGQLRLHSEE